MRLPALLALLAPAVLQVPAAVPVDEEPFHKPVLVNEWVEVLHVTVPPKTVTQWHTHSHDGVAIRLAGESVSAETPGGESTGPLRPYPGETTAQAYAARPHTHRVHNLGATPFEVIDIEILKRPPGPASEPIAEPVAENPSARAYRFTLAPGAATPVHTHERPYLVVAATSLQLTMKGPDGASMEHPVKPGDFHWVDSRVTHALLNGGRDPGILVEVELK